VGTSYAYVASVSYGCFKVDLDSTYGDGAGGLRIEDSIAVGHRADA
jgi:hypothetical protein